MHAAAAKFRSVRHRDVRVPDTPVLQLSSPHIPHFLIVPLFGLTCVCIFSMNSVLETGSLKLTPSRENLRLAVMSATRLGSGIVGPHGVDTVPWPTSPPVILMRTRGGGPLTPNTPALSVVFDMYTHASPLETMDQISNIVNFISPGTNLKIFVGIAYQEHAMVCYRLFHNMSIPWTSSVELIALKVEPRITQQTRTVWLAAHALSEAPYESLIIVLHHSCRVSLSWNASTLPRHGNGFVLLHSTTTRHALLDELSTWDLGQPSAPLYTHSAITPSPFHCSGSMMHSLHGRRD
jgi:hypothetical protein